MLGFDDIHSALEEAAPAFTHEPGCPVNTEEVRKWWAARGVDYAGVEEWCVSEAKDDISPDGIVELAVAQIGSPAGIGACLSTAYEMGLTAGFALAGVTSAVVAAGRVCESVSARSDDTFHWWTPVPTRVFETFPEEVRAHGASIAVDEGEPTHGIALGILALYALGKEIPEVDES